VKKWSTAIASGQSLSEAARTAAMPRLIVAMLKTVTGNEDLIQVMSFLSRYYESRFSRAYELFRAACVPATVFVMGAAALFLALSIFQPMVALINASCNWPRGF
jgi:type II secretory pathway component PulF